MARLLARLLPLTPLMVNHDKRFLIVCQMFITFVCVHLKLKRRWQFWGEKRSMTGK